jgi:outer membrane protein assembly factor BamA
MVQGKLRIDTRDQVTFPTSGWLGDGQLSIVPSLLDNTDTFYKLRTEVRHFYTPSFLPFTTLALRGIGEKIWGSYPFFESVFLGGNESLRGFERQRFAGDAALMGGGELRTKAIDVPFLVPLAAGVSVFAETGRVLYSGETSTRWHHVFGGGLWFWIVRPENLMNFSLARSDDKFAFYATWGFMF